MSLTPLALQNAFAMIHKSRVPEAAKRGRLFEAAVARLAEWWAGAFRVEPTGHIRSRTFDDVQKTLRPPAPPPPPPADPKGKGKGKARAREGEDEDDDGDDEARYGVAGERIRSAKSLMKHALMRRGSRDTSAQLFTALCRALGVPARLVVSLQSVPWQAGVGKPKPAAKRKKKVGEDDATGAKAKGKGKARAGEEEDEEEDDDMEDVDIPGSAGADSSRGRSPFPGNGQRLDGSSPAPSAKGKQKAAPVIRLRKGKAGYKLGSATTSEAERPRRRESSIPQHNGTGSDQRSPAGERTPDPTTTAPVFWTEVFSRADGKWIPVDPIRVIVNKRKAFDPTPNPNAPIKADKSRSVRVENRMVYVLAFEEDGYARDVTPRYAREYGAKVAKVQQGGKGRREWWERICRMVRRPYRLVRSRSLISRSMLRRPAGARRRRGRGAGGEPADGGDADVDGGVQGPPAVRARAAPEAGRGGGARGRAGQVPGGAGVPARERAGAEDGGELDAAGPHGRRRRAAAQVGQAARGDGQQETRDRGRAL